MTSRDGVGGTNRAIMGMFEQQELLFDLQSPTGTEHLPTPQGVYRVPDRVRGVVEWDVVHAALTKAWRTA